jgi:Tfp pilus assembly protein PilF
LQYQRGEYQQSIDVWQQVLAINPQSARAFNNIGTGQMKLGQHEQAQAMFRKNTCSLPAVAMMNQKEGPLLPERQPAKARRRSSGCTRFQQGRNVPRRESLSSGSSSLFRGRAVGSSLAQSFILWCPQDGLSSEDSHVTRPT